MATPTLHTNGVIYGLSARGGTPRPGYGTVYTFSAGMKPFASLIGGSRVLAGGQQVALLGQGFNTATGVMFGNVKAPFAKALSDTYMIATVPAAPVLPPTVIPTNPIQCNITVLEPSGNLVTPQIFTTWHPCGTVLCQVPTLPRVPINPLRQ